MDKNLAIETLRSFIENSDNVIAKEAILALHPELAESEDERIRAFLYHTFTAQYLCKDKTGKWHGKPVVDILAYLEKLKEFQFGYPGIYFYDGEKLHFQGNPAMEEKQKEQKPVEITPNQFDGITYEMKGYSSEKPAEWSEEDETAFGDLMWCIEQARKSAKDENDMANIWFAENWLKKKLKSLRPQPHWKPSEEQISMLLSILNEPNSASSESARLMLESLYNDLKTL